ncbi:hypothetical protein Vafri_9044, partial [Volvox africanus]
MADSEQISLPIAFASQASGLTSQQISNLQIRNVISSLLVVPTHALASRRSLQADHQRRRTGRELRKKAIGYIPQAGATATSAATFDVAKDLQSYAALMAEAKQWRYFEELNDMYFLIRHSLPQQRPGSPRRPGRHRPSSGSRTSVCPDDLDAKDDNAAERQLESLQERLEACAVGLNVYDMAARLKARGPSAAAEMPFQSSLTSIFSLLHPKHYMSYASRPLLPGQRSNPSTDTDVDTVPGGLNPALWASALPSRTLVLVLTIMHFLAQSMRAPRRCSVGPGWGHSADERRKKEAFRLEVLTGRAVVLLDALTTYF